MSPTPLSILLADDNPANQKVLQYMLERLGHRVSVVGNGLAAASACAAADFDLVFMDMMMPGMDGPSAARVIRESEAGRRRVPIIAVTANVERRDEKQCVEAGMDAFLTKPFTLDQIRATVQTYSRGRFAPTTDQGLDDAKLRTFTDTMADGDWGFTFEILEDLLVEAQRVRSGMQVALEQEDRSAIRQLAHSLKSAAAVVGAGQLSMLCEQIEYAAKEVQTLDVEAFMTRFEAAIGSLRAGIQHFRQEAEGRLES
ncbi:MAG: response regulator [Bacteroidetes bacterium]|nr:response regulator [Bacteroidota bacterium]